MDAVDRKYLDTWLEETGRAGQLISDADFESLLEWLPTSGWPRPPFAKPTDELARDFMQAAVAAYNRDLRNQKKARGVKSVFAWIFGAGRRET